jgi:hypothetical protein
MTLLSFFGVDGGPTYSVKGDYDFLEQNTYPTDPINNLERGRINPELLKIKVKLTKDYAYHAVNNNLNKKIGICCLDRVGYINFITRYTIYGISVNSAEIGIY